MLTWNKGQPLDGPAIPTVHNGPLPDGEVYRARQLRLFEAGQFGFIPVTRIRPDDQIFPDFGCGPLRVVVLAGKVWNRDPTRYVIEVEHDPGIEPDHAKDSTYHDPEERIFARRPDLDPKGGGLRDPVLELPADMDGDGNRITFLPPAARAARRAAVIKAVVRAGRRGARGAGPPSLPAEFAAEEIGLGSRPGDRDWFGRSRVFTADADMGVWVEPEPLATYKGGSS